MKLHAAQELVRAARRHAYRTAVVSFVLILFLILLGVQFLPSVSDYVEVKFSEPEHVGSPTFVAALAAAVHGTVRVGAVPEILNNGDEFVPAVVRDIRNAKHTINITNYIWNDGAFSDTLFAALDDAARRGVEVRILVDAQGSAVPKAQAATLESLGGQVRRFRPISLLTLNLLDRRDHRRAVIIDGTVAYTGGIAFDDLWLGNGLLPGHWRDMMFRVQGAVAQDMQGIFSDMWVETTGEVVSGTLFFPLSALPPSHGEATYLEIFSAPTGYFQPVREADILSIRSAEKTLDITNPYLLPDSETTQALIDAAQRGVRVRILVAGNDTDAKCVRYAGQYNYADLLAAGIRIYEYKTRLHTKTMVVDGAWSIIGSANFDSRSRALNDEDILGVSSARFASELEKTFETDLRYAQEVDPTQWAKRGVLSQLRSRVCLIFAKQF